MEKETNSDLFNDEFMRKVGVLLKNSKQLNHKEDRDSPKRDLNTQSRKTPRK